VWGNEYREGDGWTYSLYVPQNVAGLADVYGGQAGLADKLDQFFSTHETAQYGGSYGGANAIHEMVEAATNDMGEWDLSDEPGFGIPYLYDDTSEPYKTQSLVREALARDFTGSEIGQGDPGDEDNGASNVYVQSLELGGRPVRSTSIPIADLQHGADLQFTMGPKPSNWGSGQGAAAGSAASAGVVQLQDVTGPGIGTATGSGGTNVAALFDNTSSTQVAFDSATPTVTYDFPAPEKISYYTLTSGSVAGDPAAWRLQGSNDGSTWTTLDTRSGRTFAARHRPTTTRSRSRRPSATAASSSPATAGPRPRRSPRSSS
jgi:hypothetical protein